MLRLLYDFSSMQERMEKRTEQRETKKGTFYFNLSEFLKKLYQRRLLNVISQLYLKKMPKCYLCNMYIIYLVI